MWCNVTQAAKNYGFNMKILNSTCWWDKQILVFVNAVCSIKIFDHRKIMEWTKENQIKNRKQQKSKKVQGDFCSFVHLQHSGGQIVYKLDVVLT